MNKFHVTTRLYMYINLYLHLFRVEHSSLLVPCNVVYLSFEHFILQYTNNSCNVNNQFHNNQNVSGSPKRMTGAVRAQASAHPVTDCVCNGI